MSRDQLSILVVDDTPVNLILLEHLLREDGVVVVTADTPDRALQLVKDHRFALIIIDVLLPDMDGYDLAAAVKEIEHAKGTPLIFITSSHQSAENVKKGYESGAVDYLFRPVDAQKLRSKVKVFLDLHRRQLDLEREIAQRMRIERALRAAEEKYRTIFEKVVEGIFEKDLDGNYIEANPALARILGYSSASELLEIPGLGFSIFEDEDERDRYISTMRDEGLVSDWEYRAHRRNGTEVWLSESSRVVTAPDGRSRIMGVLEDISARKRSEMDLWQQATYDSLTNVPNRRSFFNHLDETLIRAGRYGLKVAVLFVDLNAFKAVNDTHGHQVGDAVLVEASRRLKEHVRASDYLARLGGDEFGVTLEAVEDADAARRVIVSLQQAMEEPFEAQGRCFRVGATIGGCLFPDHGSDRETLLKLADEAMYIAKKSGRSHAFQGD